MDTESLMILYEDNSVEVHYVDGSRLLLSPCGSEFLFEKAIPPSAHPMQPAERIHQRTQFAISLYRKQLLRAVDFRNQYSDRPYVPSNLLPPERKNIVFTDVCEAKWPHPDAASGLICRHNGGVKVSSSDGHACLFLSELQQEFSVEFLCRVSQQLSTPLPLLENSCETSTKDCCARSSPNSVSQQLQTEEKAHERCRNAKNHTQGNKTESCSSTTHEKDEIDKPFQHCLYEYCRVTQHLSVSSYPKEWKYPLSLAFMFYRTCASNEPDKGSRDHRFGGSEVSLECENSRAIICLPLALPLSCAAPYLHSWNFSHLFTRRKEDIGRYLHSQPIKVVWSKGVLYKFFLGFKSIEIFPGDGSVFKSEGSFLGKYFTRYSVQGGTKQREEKMYSVNSLPPDVPGSLYSVCGIISQAIRVLQHDLETLLSLTPSNSFCCWKSLDTGGREMLPVLLAENIIPNIGRFLAYSDNKVHAVFYDGIVLNTVWDFSSYYGKSQGREDVNSGWFKVTLPEGTQQLLQIDNPGFCERYIRTVVEWCRSLNKDRAVCTASPQPLLKEHWSVAAELEKIKRFNFLVENTNIPSKVSIMGKSPSSNTDGQSHPEESLLPEKIDEKHIVETLEKTSKVINDIDCLLAFSAK
ncbi:uncharacterized protein C5orf34 homolog isoform X2 [Heteronotia binoei]|uniref:uncharacterized protein C5orf34 homolog isoform X2 n=1 Tax=Heteronotia binoei TaxID=13085 RepID=UPI00292E23B9|nr:uncharacterized protein C5orf34 homolog isoform X2 [Heteronotia binoei]